MSGAREAMPAADLLEEVEAYVIDHCMRGGENDAPLPYEQQPVDVRAAIALVAQLKVKIA